jgi:hypothetical protein
LGSALTSKDVDGVYGEIESFAADKLKMTKAYPDPVEATL